MTEAGATAAPARPGALAAWLRHCRWAWRASVLRLARRPFGTGLTILVLGLALAMPLALWLLLANVQQVLDTLGDSRAVSVFLEPSAGLAEAEQLRDALRARPDVLAVDLKSPEQGLAELAAMQGFGEAVQDLGYNPLPWVLLVEPAGGEDTATTLHLAAELRGLEGIDLVQDDAEWRTRTAVLLQLGRRAFALLAALLVLAMLMVVGQTVRQDVRSRAAEIAVLRLAGASPRFVRRPYLLAGTLYGAGAGIVTLGLVLAMEAALAAPARQLVGTWGEELAVRGLGPAVLLLTPLVAAALGWLGARIVTTALARHDGR